MILYKYASFSSAVKIIKSGSIGFTCLEDLNDPFEGTNFGFSSLGSISPQTATQAFKNHFSRKFALLSLTRNPLNPLMWSHYGDSHRGAVVGIDIAAAGLMSFEEFVVPAQLGEILYTTTKTKDCAPSLERLNEIKKNDLKFSSDIENYLKQAFLYKSSEWAYEEEVRVIKSLTKFQFSYHSLHDQELSNTPLNKWSKIRNGTMGQPLFCFNIPKNSIKEVYLGTNFYRNACRTNEGNDKKWFDEQLKYLKEQNFELFTCEPDYRCWNLCAKELMEYQK